MGEIAAQLVSQHGVPQADAVAMLAPIAAHTGDLVDFLGEAWGLDDKAIGEALRAGHDLLAHQTSSSSQHA